MDIRQTFASTDELKEILTSLQSQKVHVAFLIDREGLFRASGKITDINKDVSINEVIVCVDVDATFLLTEIIAVNGIFRSDYSEC